MADPARVMTIGTIMVDLLAVDLPAVAEPGRVVYTPHDIATQIGGHPIDVAIDLVKMGYPSGSIGVVAAVGEGMYGTFVTRVVEEYRLTHFLQRVGSHDTGKNLVLEVAGEDRRFHIDPGANWHLRPEHVADALQQFAPHIVSLRPGYSGIDLHLVELLEPLPDPLVMLDVMQPHPDRPPDLVRSALPFVDVVHCNEREALVVTGTQTIAAAVGTFLSAGVGAVLVTAGEQGARLFTAEHQIRQPAFRVPTVDATGCGDAFCAGVIASLLGHSSLPTGTTLPGLGGDEAARLLAYAQAMGASAATKAGCVEGVAAEVVERLWTDQVDAVLGSTEIARR